MGLSGSVAATINEAVTAAMTIMVFTNNHIVFLMSTINLLLVIWLCSLGVEWAKSTMILTLLSLTCLKGQKNPNFWGFLIRLSDKSWYV